MENIRQEIYMAIGTLWSFQCIYLGIKKRKGKNFYHEPKLMNLLPTGGSTLLLVYDFMEAWKLGTDSVSNFNIILLGILVLSTVFVVFRSFLGGKKYTVYNIAKTDIEAILLQTLKKYELECKKEEKNPHSIVTKILLEQYDASVEMTQRGGSGTTFDLVFEKFDRVYNFEDIVADIKESINESTKVSRFRGVHEFAAAIGIVLFFVWMSIL